MLLKNYFHVPLAESWQKKPKSFRTSLCVIAALVGWQLIREKVLEKFAKCKQHEFVTILRLLEHVVPLVFYQYNVFRSGDLKLYEKVVAQIAIIFLCWRRIHYDKLTLSFLSDCAYQCKHVPEYLSKKASILKLITEKKVEVWHSVLQRNTERFNDSKSIEQQNSYCICFGVFQGTVKTHAR